MSVLTTIRAVPSRVTVSSRIAGALLAVAPLAASQAAIDLQKQLNELRFYLESPASSGRDRRRERFNNLARQWREDTQWLSSTTEIAMHPAYQAIIGMGPGALPMIVNELRADSGDWFWALKAISNEDPVPPCDRGVINKMKIAWLRWAEQKEIDHQ
jgi:hypothetical protein